MKSESRNEPTHRLRDRQNRGKMAVGLSLLLAGVMSVGGQLFVPTAHTSTAAGIPGDLNTHRRGHTATLLTDGKVLIVGGGSADSELFDPETGKWSLTGSLRWARARHTATILTDGKVLVTAGENLPGLGGPLKSAEVYDPATGEWSTTGKLLTKRVDHTATLLPDGKVLVAGGLFQSGSVEVLGSCELYDPNTGRWSETGRLNIPRFEHSATLLPNGKVLVAGGVGMNPELYDPNTGTWSFTGNLNTQRTGHTATLLQTGKVLVAGGSDGGDFDDLLLSAELYDPETGAWEATGSLNRDHFRGTATLLDSGKVLVDTELYDPESGIWSLAGETNVSRGAHTATLLLDGKVLGAGGSAFLAGALKSCELYDPDTETWIGPPVPVITGTLIDGQRLVVFGENFGPGAVIVRNNIALPTKDLGETNSISLVAKKKGGKTKPGDRLRVLNSSGALSKQFVFSGS